jgi:ankyrin repeat protein
MIRIHFFSFVAYVIEDASPETAHEVSKYLENLFKNEKIELRKFLSHRDKYGNSIFSWLENKKEVEEELKIFVELLRKTFDENQDEKFEKDLKNLKLKLKVFHNFENLENIRSFPWSAGDFEFFIENFTENEEKLVKILTSKNKKGWTLLHEIVFNDANENFIESFLKKVQQVLNKTEISSLIFAQENEDDETSLVFAARFRKLKDLKVFWNFLDENLNEEEKVKILLMEQKSSRTALHYSTWNDDPNSFLFMKEICEKFFTQEKIREIFKKTHKDFVSFIYRMIEYASPETAHEVSKYLENLFENEKIELRKILSHRDSDGNSIFSWFKDKKYFEKKLKIFVELLRKTFDENQDEKFEKDLKILKLKLKIFQNFENLDDIRSSLWSDGDFELIIENFTENKEKLVEILTSRNNQGLTLLHEIVFNDENEIFIESFLKKTQENLNKTEISSLIFAQESKYDETSLMWAAKWKKLKDLKVFWNFLDENLNDEEKKKILLMESKAPGTPLQLSTANTDPNSFLFMKDIYEKFFTQEKIREILKKTQKDYFPFVYGVIRYASPETALEVSKYLENLFENEKIELRKILSHRDKDVDSIFSWLKYQKYFEEKLKIFVELLRKTFDENQEEFESFYRNLEIKINL